ncbi:bZIP transcription factor TRAB1-like isoform X2 [Nymphaea colorata]|uniref:bZIP transcription factor TRAB1-like isoform X2 n=1 Tax=Nymphaea colorata TaxID=210225 RepID=UPI00129DB1AE|nr:bZIP transcription factor TRAB1-like isoform X2 [Nymphaea colorata]
MGSDLFFKNGLPEARGENGSRTENARSGNLLSRQSSVYSLTLDEFQSGLGKDFGSMNMDEFLKNIWFAEETQSFSTSPCTPEGNSGGLSRQFSLQRQGSLTLPRTLSLKTVDEVFRDVIKESVDQTYNIGTAPHKQPTLGEMTLEEFLVKAGVVREDTQTASASNSGIFLSNSENSAVGNGNAQVGSDIGLALGFGQPAQANGNLSRVAYQEVIAPAGNSVSTLEAFRSSQPQQQQQNHHHHQQQKQLSWRDNQHNRSPVVQPTKQQQHQFLGGQPTIVYASSLQMANNEELKTPGIGNGQSLSHVVGSAGIGGQAGSEDPGGILDAKPSVASVCPSSSDFISGGIQGGASIVSETTASLVNQIASDTINKSDGDNSSLSPVPYPLNGVMRGRRGGGSVEKVIERRQRRMIKNRESAARSRARKQAYTMELEAEVAKLKEENMKLKKKQVHFRPLMEMEYIMATVLSYFTEEIMKMQKAQALEKLNKQLTPKKRCLRRTLTGPW